MRSRENDGSVLLIFSWIGVLTPFLTSLDLEVWKTKKRIESIESSFHEFPDKKKKKKKKKPAPLRTHMKKPARIEQNENADRESSKIHSLLNSLLMSRHQHINFLTKLLARYSTVNPISGASQSSRSRMLIVAHKKTQLNTRAFHLRWKA